MSLAYIVSKKWTVGLFSILIFFFFFKKVTWATASTVYGLPYEVDRHLWPPLWLPRVGPAWQTMALIWQELLCWFGGQRSDTKCTSVGVTLALCLYRLHRPPTRHSLQAIGWRNPVGDSYNCTMFSRLHHDCSLQRLISKHLGSLIEVVWYCMCIASGTGKNKCLLL